jgi:hypothetical protein
MTTSRFYHGAMEDSRISSIKKWLTWTQVANVWVGMDKIPYSEKLSHVLETPILSTKKEDKDPFPCLDHI